MQTIRVTQVTEIEVSAFTPKELERLDAILKEREILANKMLE